ncbi:MAG: TRAP transporter small permease [Oceanospirillales bacterium]|nr:TRAP transporter small permease [Oceanospirillales bacterium]MBR9886314.1 TRAP transporter small permease [Oceanospirillales bacterium]
MAQNAFTSIHRGLLLIQRYVMGVTTVLISVLIFVQVFIRYFLDIPLYGVEEIAAYLAVWLYFIGAGYGIYRGNHISASVMDLVLLTSKSKDLFHAFVSIITLALICWMFSLCLDYLQWSIKRTPKSPELRLPLYYVHVGMVIGLGLMAFYSLFEVIRRFIFIVKGEGYVSIAVADDKKNKAVWFR